MIQYYNLADRIQYFSIVVDWLYEEWGDRKNNNRIYWESWVKSSLSKDDIPQTYIVLEKEEIIGTFSLWRCDLQSRQDLFPWLGGIFVKKEMRGKGVGIYIQNAAQIALRKLGYNRAYLFTDLNGFYEKTGWVFIDNIPDEKGNMVRLYSLMIKN
ncbi:GNAT family N-acetyltransferase [Bacteroides fragilis]|uniref:GNAT family N-acetyltransferase n=1 Tax=Bacteroides fragilis TaxID=817 RepID=UPI00202E703D|nr:GNAT family N-acetyltransferase [Bacteroides fragilis]MCM0239827.1 GNAT family N-acetyltransferase [Bacteroides fragilis]